MLPVAGAVILLLWSRQWLKRAIVEPLVSVQRATEEISKGDLAHRVPVVGADELRQLGISVNQMATDLATSRESLVRAEKEAMLAALVPVVAHNIRNPLASIRATAQVMDDGSLPDEVRDGLKGIIGSTDRLEHWTHALLSYLNPLEPQRTLCRAATLVENMERMLRPRLTQKKITIELSQFDRDVELRIDAQLIEQALLGLVQNAVDASPEGSSVHLSLARAGDSIAIAVVDHGSGMPFSPAPRDLKPGPSTKRFGTGLGIPFAMKVFDRHGGSVRFSRAESGGTCVSISLPA
jgi:signal transduction histidine kinase